MLTFWYKHCERVTSTGSYIRELDGLRFLALSMVFLLHLNHAVLSHPGIEAALSSFQRSICGAMEYGALGVQVFFCISGFILGLPFARSALLDKDPVSLKTFYVRRLTRLEPPLIIHLTIMLVIYTVFVGKSFSEMLPHYGATVTYLHSHLYGHPSPLNPMTWSLEVEAQFYLSTPLLCMVFFVKRKSLRRIVIIGAILLSGLFGGMPRTVLLSQLPIFLSGFLLADIYLTDWKSRPKRSFWGDLIALASIVGFVFACAFHKSIPLIQSFVGLLIFGFFVGVFRGHFFGTLFRIRVLATIGGMCYTFYLYHLAVITLCFRLLDRFFENWGYFEFYGITFLIVGTINLVICSVLFIFFERPFMKWRPRPGNWLNGMFDKTTKGTAP